MGCAYWHKASGLVIAQDEKRGVVFGMPKAAITAKLAHELLSLDAIAPGSLRLLAVPESEIIFCWCRKGVMDSGVLREFWQAGWYVSEQKWKAGPGSVTGYKSERLKVPVGIF
jgi:hypothetical protein